MREIFFILSENRDCDMVFYERAGERIKIDRHGYVDAFMHVHIISGDVYISEVSSGSLLAVGVDEAEARINAGKELKQYTAETFKSSIAESIWKYGRSPYRNRRQD